MAELLPMDVAEILRISCTDAKRVMSFKGERDVPESFRNLNARYKVLVEVCEKQRLPTMTTLCFILDVTKKQLKADLEMPPPERMGEKPRQSLALRQLKKVFERNSVSIVFTDRPHRKLIFYTMGGEKVAMLKLFCKDFGIVIE